MFRAEGNPLSHQVTGLSPDWPRGKLTVVLLLDNCGGSVGPLWCGLPCFRLPPL